MTEQELTRTDSTEPGLPNAVARLVALDKGLYAFRILGNAPWNGAAPGFTVPAVHISEPPGGRSGLEITDTHGQPAAWLGGRHLAVFVRSRASGAQALVTAYPARDPELPPLRIEVRRLDAAGLPGSGRGKKTSGDVAIPQPPFATLSLADPAAAPMADEEIPIEIVVHLRRRGDVRFFDAPWAGRVGPGLWIESFAILPRHRLAAAAVEYKGLTAAGTETDWLGSGSPCGTRGKNNPLLGFAVRQKAIRGNTVFDCLYSGYFQSGAVIGPCRNGTPCLSPTANDPLEGIQLRVIGRPKRTDPAQRAEQRGSDRSPA